MIPPSEQAKPKEAANSSSEIKCEYLLRSLNNIDEINDKLIKGEMKEVNLSWFNK